MLYYLIFKVLVEPVLLAADPLQGQWSSLHGSTAEFFNLFGIRYVPDLILAALLVFALEGLEARRATNIRFKMFVVGGGSLMYALLFGVMVTKNMFSVDQHIHGVSDVILTMLVVPLAIILLMNALGLFGFWLPSIACGAYTMFSKHPRWWVASLLGTAVLILGAWLWILLGTLVGAATD